MTNINSPASFIGQELLFEDVPIELVDPGTFENTKNNLEKIFRNEHEFLESLAQNAYSTFHCLEEKIMVEKDNQERKREKKNVLFAKVITARQTLDELFLKKNALKTENVDLISKDELTELLKKVVQLEREQESAQDDMKMKLNIFIGQMCFYKEYLNVYIDIPLSNDFILYFRKCRADDNNKPQEWIQIKTDDFKKFYVVDISSRGKLSDELLEKIRTSDKPLRELIVEARELCFNVL